MAWDGWESILERPVFADVGREVRFRSFPRTGSGVAGPTVGAPSGLSKRQSRAQSVQWTPRAAGAQPQDRPALGMVAERSRRVQIAQDDDTGSRRGFCALGAESCLPQIPHAYVSMLSNRPKQKKYYAINMLPPLWLSWECQAQRNPWNLIPVGILITNSEILRAEIARD